MKKKFLPPEIKRPVSSSKKVRRYYIQFHTFHPFTGEKLRHRDYISRSKFPTDQKQEVEVKRRFDIHLSMLNSGNHPKFFGERLESSMEKAHKVVWGVWQKNLEYRTAKSYNCIFKCFFDYTIEKHGANTKFKDYTREMAIDYCDYLVLKKSSPKTVENYTSLISSLYKKLNDRGFVLNNPFLALDLPKSKIKRIRYVDRDERVEIFEYLRQKDVYCYRFVLLQYFLLTRPSEAVDIKINDIKLYDQRIRISHRCVKNDRDKFVRIPDVLMSIFLGMNLQNIPSNYYLFAKGLEPGPEKIHHISRTSDIFRKHRKSQNWSNDVVVYDFKSTGIIDYLNAGVPAHQIQIQAGISWEKMEDYINVQSMVCAGSELVQNAMPIFTKDNFQQSDNLTNCLKYFFNLKEHEKERFLGIASPKFTTA